MKTLLVILGLLSTTGYALDTDSLSLKIPHEDLDKAAHTVIGNYSSYSGKLECSTSLETSNCIVNFGGDTAVVENSEKIVKAVSRVRTPSGVDDNFAGTFFVVRKTVGSIFGPKKEVTEATLTLE